MIMITATTLFFRSFLISYSYLYFPNYSQIYIEKIDKFFTKINLPILSETKYLNLKNFVATIQKQEVRFSGIIRNNSNMPILTPRIKILGIREDRKIILENTLILEDKIIPKTSEIRFNKLNEIENKQPQRKYNYQGNSFKKFLITNQTLQFFPSKLYPV